jgi:Fe-S cluster assembly ATP-binding protein
MEKKDLLKIENLWGKTKEKEILRGINLNIKEREIHALLGPNASGKTTLGLTIAGLPSYQIEEGKIFFEGKDITSLLPEERAKKGLAVCFQHPPTIRGLLLGTLLERIAPQKKTDLGEELLSREVNLDFSGGEKKFSEIIQIINLDPKLVIFDELDSGLDLENLEKLARLVKEKLLENGRALLLISHHPEIFRFLQPDFVHVMIEGRIIHTSQDFKEVWKTIEKYGYEKCKNCPFLAG